MSEDPTPLAQRLTDAANEAYESSNLLRVWTESIETIGMIRARHMTAAVLRELASDYFDRQCWHATSSGSCNHGSCLETHGRAMHLIGLADSIEKGEG